MTGAWRISLLALLTVMFVCLFANLSAQTKDTTLHEVRVRGKRKVSNDARVNIFSPGQKVKTIDSSTLQEYRLQNMANLLAQQEPVFVKSYGVNGLATLNFRGSSAAQSAVLWNGVPIQNAALGIADVSTLPVLFMNKVNIVYGGSGALWGSGNVGGALLLENETPAFDSGHRALSLSGGAGRFSQYLAGLNGSLSGKRWYFSANVFGQTAKNDFPYTNAVGASVSMPNSRLQSGGALVQAAYKIKDQNVVSLSAWYQQYDREIPPALFEMSSVKKQKDGSLRTLLCWNKQRGDNNWYVKSSFIRDEVNYRDDAIQIVSDNVVYQYFQEAGWRRQLYKYGQLLVFVPVQIAWLNQLGNLKQQDKTALAAAYDVKLFQNKLDVAANARGETIMQQPKDSISARNIFLPGVDASFAVTQWLSVKANVQRTYRLPTLNELYYFPGGNTSLKPEQGWNEDGGYVIKLGAGSWSVYHELSAFTRDIHDWIYWVGGAIWTPHNIAEVHSRGVETENNITYTTGKWKFHLGVNTEYVLATTVASYFPNDGSIGKQIPYTPRYNGQANIGFSYKKFSINYNHTYTGYRFTTTDESSYLLPYHTGNVQAMYTTSIDKHALQITMQCNNVWNEHYEVVDQRPMPGINWLFGFKLGIL